MEPNLKVLWSRPRARRNMQAPQQDARSEEGFDDDDGILSETLQPKPAALRPSTSDTEELRAFRNRWQTELRPQRRDEPGRTQGSAPALPRTSQQASSKERSSSRTIMISRSDDDSSDQESPGEGPLGHLLCEQYSVEPAQAGSLAYIGLLPAELLIRVLSNVDVYSVEASSAVCRRWFAVARDNSLWRLFCFSAWGALPPSASRAYGRSWRNLYLKRPRIRSDGLYISKNTYFRQGLTEGAWNQTVHRVVYYRYLRFYTDGSVIAWTGPEVPRDVAEWLRAERPGRAFSRGCWVLNDTTVQLWVNSPSQVNGRRSTFTMNLGLSSTVEGRNNRLAVEQYNVQAEGQPAERLLVEISRFFFARLPPHLL